MYYESKDDAARARNTALNEDLGQIEYYVVKLYCIFISV